MQPETNRKAISAPGNCLGCRECAGLCQAVLELALVPETVLRHGAPLR